MRLRSLLVIGLMMVAATLAGGSPAQAHSTEPNFGGEPFVCGDLEDVYACFEQNGDDFWIRDRKVDGYRAGVRFWTSDGAIGSCENTHGAWTWHECTYDLNENGGHTGGGIGQVRFQQYKYDLDTDDLRWNGRTYCAYINEDDGGSCGTI